MISVDNLTVKYGTKVAVDNLSFNVDKGDIIGIVGRNGSGKTSTVESICGLRKMATGIISINGLNPLKDRQEIQKIFGIQFQESSYPKHLKVKEVCKLFSSFYDNVLDYNTLLKKFDLSDHANHYVSKLSGGQKQRLSIILALLHNPDYIILDEITTGLDPEARRKIWDTILELKEQRKTIILVSHFMDEVEYLCDKVLFIDKGKKLAYKTVNDYIDELNYEEKVSFMVRDTSLISSLKSINKVKEINVNGKEVLCYGDKYELSKTIEDYLNENKIDYYRFKVISPSFEDVFFNYLGGGVNESNAQFIKI